MDKPTPGEPKSGYSKHSKSFWIITYLIIAIVVYGLIYLIFFHKSGSASSNGGFSY